MTSFASEIFAQEIERWLPNGFEGHVDEDFPDCFTVNSTASYESLVSKLDQLSVSTCDDRWSFYDEDGDSCATPDSIQTAHASTYASSSLNHSLHEDDNSGIVSMTSYSQFWDNNKVSTPKTHDDNAFEIEVEDNDAPPTVDSLIQLYRSQKKSFSFYYLPELNTKPVDLAPRLEYVASQYELPEMHEFAAHNNPWSAQKLKLEYLRQENQ